MDDWWEGLDDVGGGMLDWWVEPDEVGGGTVHREEVEDESVEPAVNLIRY